MKKKNVLRNEEGFTLVEIIAVLVILGILAAVAIPKYFDMQSQARDRALEGAMAEAIARVNGKFGTSILGGSTYDQIDYSGLGGSMGDFNLVVTGGAPGTGDIGLKVIGTVPALSGDSKSRSYGRPGAP
jgi:prepilin-type N-terminal cleavage/methylation domain-containing protein